MARWDIKSGHSTASLEHVSRLMTTLSKSALAVTVSLSPRRKLFGLVNRIKAQIKVSNLNYTKKKEEQIPEPAHPRRRIDTNDAERPYFDSVLFWPVLAPE